MKNETLFDKLSDLKEKFKGFFVHKKKLRALENYSSVGNFQHMDYLLLIKKCMDDGFLGEKEADFLCYMLDQYSINFLDWSHKTPWLKKEMKKLQEHYQEKKPQQLTFFDYKQFAPSAAFDHVTQHITQHQTACRA